MDRKTFYLKAGNTINVLGAAALIAFRHTMQVAQATPEDIQIATAIFKSELSTHLHQEVDALPQEGWTPSRTEAQWDADVAQAEASAAQRAFAAGGETYGEPQEALDKDGITDGLGDPERGPVDEMPMDSPQSMIEESPEGPQASGSQSGWNQDNRFGAGAQGVG